MTTYSLTQKQKDALNFITAEIRKDGVSPSYEEIKVALGIKSKSGVHRLVTALVERGHLKKFGARARTLSIPLTRNDFSTLDALHQADMALADALQRRTGWAKSVEQAREFIKQARAL